MENKSVPEVRVELLNSKGEIIQISDLREVSND